MLEFCKAAVAATHADPPAIRLHIPQDMPVAEITCSDGSTSYDVLVSSAGCVSARSHDPLAGAAAAIMGEPAQSLGGCQACERIPFREAHRA